MVLWGEYLQITGDCDEAYRLHLADHFTAFASSQDIKLKIPPIYSMLLHASSNWIS